MTRDHDPLLPASLDDEAIGLLVRDVAEGWTMPPVRLDAPGWRERVRGRRARLADSMRSSLGRAGQAAMAAVALTVVAALVAVVITRPPQQPAGSPDATASATDSPVARATPLPKLVVNGDLPQPARLLVGTESGDLALVDLEKGTVGEHLTGAERSSGATVLGDGTIVCLCVYTRERLGSWPSTIEVRLRTFTADGAALLDEPIETFVGQQDPRDPVPTLEPVSVSVSFGDGGRFGYVAWTLREGSVWHAGVLSVDLATGSILGAQVLPDVTTGEGEQRRFVLAPMVTALGDKGTAIVGQTWIEWATANTDGMPWLFGNAIFRGTTANGVWSDFEAMPDAADCGDQLIRAGQLPVDGGAWLACLRASDGDLVLRRLDTADALIDTQEILRDPSVDGDTTALGGDGRVLYAWNPATSTMTRIDLGSGDRVDRAVGATTAARSPLNAFGDWLAPSVAAKSILRGAVVPSADGRRVYVLGVAAGPDSSELSGSAGVIVLDAATLNVIDRWAPTADFVSLTLSSDGRFLYAAGMPGVDANGRRSAQSASVTVFDTSDGSVRLIAGELGTDLLTFPGAFVR